MPVSDITFEGLVEKTKSMLGENYKGDQEVVDVCKMVIQEAAQWTNRNADAKLMNECWPVIVKCSCVAYLNRGAEGLASQSELGQQNVYTDWVALLHKQVTNRRHIL